MKTSIIGVGQPHAGDDGVGLVVIKQLRHQRIEKNIKLIELVDPTELIDELQIVDYAIIVDALVDGKVPGTIQQLNVEQLAKNTLLPLSSHAVSISQAIEIANQLAGDKTTSIDVIGISIEAPRHLSRTLSAQVKKAIPKTIEKIQQIIQQNTLLDISI